MREEIPNITRIMKELTDIRDKFTSKSTKDMVDGIIYDLKDLRDLMDY